MEWFGFYKITKGIVILWWFGWNRRISKQSYNYSLLYKSCIRLIFKAYSEICW